MKKIAVVLVLSLLTTSLYAHGGRTDKNGCHKEAKTGERHCH
ncbi:YHYH domain-containing protein [Acinetobacter sp. SwsAc5]|nr:YHYH domain-containing protein [Acinetobacter sp. SwsAc5]